MARIDVIRNVLKGYFEENLFIADEREERTLDDLVEDLESALKWQSQSQ